MDAQTQIEISIHEDPQQVETAMQERSCDPAPDSSLPADAVLTDRMSDLDETASPALFVP
jgi:hypothetical protein